MISAATALTQSGDFTITALFMNADPVVKAVIGLLGLVSVASWAIILEKAIRMAALRRDVRRLEAMADEGCPATRSRLSQVLLAAAALEEGGASSGDRSDMRNRLERAMRHFGIEGDQACTSPNAIARIMATFPTTTSSATSGPAPRNRRSSMGCSKPKVCRLLDRAWLKCSPNTAWPAR